LSGSLQRISKETFSSTSNECFSTCTGLPNCESWVIIFHVNFHGLGFIILSWEEMSPQQGCYLWYAEEPTWVYFRLVLFTETCKMYLPFKLWTRIGCTSFPEGVETRDPCSCTLLFSLFTPKS
jgi:hypothetical protein